MEKIDDKILKLRDRTFVIIDWANVYGWFKNIGWEIDVKNLFDYLNTYKEIIDKIFYFGIEIGNIKSEQFQEQIKGIGFTLVSKEVKFVPATPDKKILRRKCDFDVEITRDILNSIDKFNTLILFSGDVDYAPLVDDIIKKGKKVILVFAPGHKGKEYGDFKKGLFLCSVNKLKDFLEK